MVKQNFYLITDGELRRKDNTLYFENSEGKRILPIENIDSIYVFSTLRLNNRALEFASYNEVPIHFFNYYGTYVGSYYPKERLVSGYLLLKQVEHYTDMDKRIDIAREFVDGAISNIQKNLYTLQTKIDNNKILEIREQIQVGQNLLKDMTTIEELMGLEGSIRKKYYEAIDIYMLHTNGEYVMDGRVKRPPNNKMNSLISYGNSMMYATILNEIYKTQLNPTISYLHELQDRRFSLSLDVSEIFKPFIIDRIIFRLIGLNMLDNSCFEELEGICYLSNKGKRKFIQEYDDRLKTTIRHRQLNRKVSYQRLIRLELYKLVKHLIGETKYRSFKIWW